MASIGYPISHTESQPEAPAHTATVPIPWYVWCVVASLTSAVFALLHAEQTGFAWGAVAILFCVSLVLCAVRLLFRSVAASTLVHVSYNSMLFLSLIHATGGYRHFEWIAK